MRVLAIVPILALSGPLVVATHSVFSCRCVDPLIITNLRGHGIDGIARMLCICPTRRMSNGCISGSVIQFGEDNDRRQKDLDITDSVFAIIAHVGGYSVPPCCCFFQLFHHPWLRSDDVAISRRRILDLGCVSTICLALTVPTPPFQSRPVVLVPGAFICGIVLPNRHACHFVICLAEVIVRVPFREICTSICLDPPILTVVSHT